MAYKHPAYDDHPSESTPSAILQTYGCTLCNESSGFQMSTKVNSVGAVSILMGDSLRTLGATVLCSIHNSFIFIYASRGKESSGKVRRSSEFSYYQCAEFLGTTWTQLRKDLTTVHSYHDMRAYKTTYQEDERSES
jgi:hypothetical protein